MESISWGQLRTLKSDKLCIKLYGEEKIKFHLTHDTGGPWVIIKTNELKELIEIKEERNNLKTKMEMVAKIFSL